MDWRAAENAMRKASNPNTQAQKEKNTFRPIKSSMIGNFSKKKEGQAVPDSGCEVSGKDYVFERSL